MTYKTGTRVFIFIDSTLTAGQNVIKVTGKCSNVISWIEMSQGNLPQVAFIFFLVFSSKNAVFGIFLCRFGILVYPVPQVMAAKALFRYTTYC